jgi:hypothetical protein
MDEEEYEGLLYEDILRGEASEASSSGKEEPNIGMYTTLELGMATMLM